MMVSINAWYRGHFCPPSWAGSLGSGSAHLALPVAAQLAEQSFGILQVGSVEALGEPVVNVGERRPRFSVTVGVTQQAR